MKSRRQSTLNALVSSVLLLVLILCASVTLAQPKPVNKSQPPPPTKDLLIVELLDKGTFDAWEKLTAETPETVLDLLELPGVGPKTAAMLHQKFKIASLDDLRKFADGGGLEMVDGIGAKTADRIKASLSRP